MLTSGAEGVQRCWMGASGSAGQQRRGLDRAKVGVMVVVTVVVYPLDERGERGGGQREVWAGQVEEGCTGFSFQDLLFCHQTLPRPLITNQCFTSLSLYPFHAQLGASFIVPIRGRPGRNPFSCRRRIDVSKPSEKMRIKGFPGRSVKSAEGVKGERDEVQIGNERTR